MPKTAPKSPNQVKNNAKIALKQSATPVKPMIKPNFNAPRPMNANMARPKPMVMRRNSPSQ
jgi:hypothetical protein